MKKITIHIDDYTKKDGTEVSGYDRDVEVRDLTDEEIAQREEAKILLSYSNLSNFDELPHGESLDVSLFPNDIGELERKIKDNDYETAFVFDTEGKLIFAKKGSKENVRFKLTDIVAFEGGILTHNHPSGIRGLSQADLLFLGRSKLSKIRAITGVGETFELELTGKVTNKGLKSSYTRNKNKIHSEWMKQIKEGNMTLEFAKANFTHEIIKRISDNNSNLVYRYDIQD